MGNSEILNKQLTMEQTQDTLADQLRRIQIAATYDAYRSDSFLNQLEKLKKHPTK